VGGGGGRGRERGRMRERETERDGKNEPQPSLRSFFVDLKSFLKNDFLKEKNVFSDFHQKHLGTAMTFQKRFCA